MGLRLKFNLLIVPLVAAMTILMVWADYRHEAAAMMASHAMHSGPVGMASQSGPVHPSTLPEVVASNSLRAHIAYGVGLLALLVMTVNAALHVMVLRPLQGVQALLVRMERGYWHGSTAPTTNDEMGQFVRAFQTLGVEIGSAMGQRVQADRLSVLALISQQLRNQIEPDLQRVVEIAASLNRDHEAETQAAAQEIARRAASMFATVRGLDRAF